MSRKEIPTNVLDHIIHLSPPGELQAGIERFERLGFKVLPGGTHADGLTSNALVVLDDGVYLELIAFTHDVDYYAASASSTAPPGLLEKRRGHWWQSKLPGWIDWANLGFGGEAMADVLMNPNSDGGGAVANVGGNGGDFGVKYLAPVEGGRTKPDGDVLKWRVTFPDSAAHGRGALPFFCEDLTPRNRRVSRTSAQSPAAHPCKATGIAYISLSAATSISFTALCAQLSLVLGENPRFLSDGEEARWALNVPQGTTPTSAKPRPEIVLRTATVGDPDLQIPGSDKAWIDQVGFWVDQNGHTKDDDDGGFFGDRGSETGPNLGNVSGVGQVAFVPLPRTG
ncbi:hypothetical protein M407DRAFT_216117 [Tulasnella calospora MUT 4182]|uniref:Glyoxalase-like domain-containing protein n=1 Tax=Tulasnella calospora MUT 4182 TaxID=1051891 RepID=A0A0C3KN01_9AGAM|nr:hypothetical protein M407DRAFT_216117 [Tulasnella calospora MUT 4182]